MNKKLVTIPAFMLAIGALSIGFSTPASADMLGIGAHVDLNNSALHVRADANTTAGQKGDMQHPGVFGTVTAVNGSTITVQSKTFTKGSTSSTATTYTVNVGSATIMKNNAASSLSAIAVGDSVMVQGTVSGTTVTATKIDDGVMVKTVPGSNGGATIPNGNGQPIIGGKVTAVNGSTVTITNSSNVSYTIDATNAKVTKNGTTSTSSNIAVGDTILAQGTINGTSVTAVNIVDSANTTTTGTTTTHKGILGAIGGFFSKLFGF